MKHLWLILFVIPLFGQSPCDDEKYLKLREEIKKDPIAVNDLDFDYFASFAKKCKKFKRDALRKEEGEIKKTLSETKKPCDEEERNKLDEGSQERKKFDKNCRKYIREKNLKFADENINKLKSSGSYNKGDYNSNAGRELAQYLLNAYDEYKGEGGYSSPSLSFGDAQKRGCNIYGKIKFVEYGEDYKVKFVSYGENLKVKYVDFGESQAGNWKVVEFGERYKIKVVEYGEDFTVKTVSYGQGCNQ